jgi:hypothetical protein
MNAVIGGPHHRHRVAELPLQQVLQVRVGPQVQPADAVVEAEPGQA